MSFVESVAASIITVLGSGIFTVIAAKIGNDRSRVENELIRELRQENRELKEEKEG